MNTNETQSPDSLHRLVQRLDPMIWANEWLCDCGQRADARSPDWRWNGHTWEHCHGYPTGHCATERKPPNAELSDSRPKQPTT